MESFTHLNVSDIQNWNIGDTSQNSNAEKVTLDIVASSNEVRTVMRKVTLDDFIIPEYRGKNPEDYEFRHDGKIVRKDRWETGIHKIHTMLVEAGAMKDQPEFEIDDVVESVRSLLEPMLERKYFISYMTKNGYSKL